MKTLILGIGNLLMGDEGVGVHVVRRLEETALPADVEVLDGGTGGFHLMGHLQAYPHVVLIDAALDGQPPGTLSSLKPRYAKDYPPTLTAHDIGLKDLLDALYLLDSRPDIMLFTISIDFAGTLTTDLTPAVEASVPRVIDAVLAHIHAAP